MKKSLFTLFFLGLIMMSHDVLSLPQREGLQALVDYEGIPAEYRDGIYKNAPKLFLFCRQDRRYHCLLMLKDSNGELVREGSGKFWSLPALALARKGKPATVKEGYTPSGVYTIDSVMPEADRQIVYGQYRRLIMNFIPKSNNEALLKSFLPAVLRDSDWWQESKVARDIGRTALRIHGAGFKNYNPFSKHYPFVKTVGCISMREGQYGSKYYQDQRILLDEMMKAQGLTPKYENETAIRAVLYVIEINNRKGPVTLDEMNWYLERS